MSEEEVEEIEVKEEEMKEEVEEEESVGFELSPEEIKMMIDIVQKLEEAGEGKISPESLKDLYKSVENVRKKASKGRKNKSGKKKKTVSEKKHQKRKKVQKKKT